MRTPRPLSETNFPVTFAEVAVVPRFALSFGSVLGEEAAPPRSLSSTAAGSMPASYLGRKELKEGKKVRKGANVRKVGRK